MDVYFDTLTSAAEQIEISRWCATNDSSHVKFITIKDPAVTVHGSTAGYVAVAGYAARRGHLARELDQALTVMRRASAI
jgi:hypothetical protein